MRHLLIIILVLTTTQFSCTNSAPPGSFGAILPSAVGVVDEVFIVMDEDDWSSSLGDTVRHFFQKPYEILPQYESLFKIHHVKPTAFQELFKKGRNVVLFVRTDRKQAAFRIGERIFGDQIVKPSQFIIGRKNVWAEGQQVIMLNASDRASMVSKLAQNFSKVKNLIHQNDAHKLFKSNFVSGVHEVNTQLMADKFGIKWDIPRKYAKAYDDNGIIWFRRDEGDEILNIMISTEPYLEVIHNKAGLNARARTGRFVQGPSDGSEMVTADKYFPPESKYVMIDGVKSLETRGLWELTEDFMGGPFVNYVIPDKERDRLIVIDAFVYAPAKKKKPYIRRLESWIRSVRIL